MDAIDPPPDAAPGAAGLPVLLTAQEVADVLRVPLSWVYGAGRNGARCASRPATRPAPGSQWPP